MILIMLRTYIYLPEHLDKKIDYTAKTQKTSKAEIIRQALEKGLLAVQYQGGTSAQALLKIAEIGEKNNEKGPKDLSENLNNYLWGIE